LARLVIAPRLGSGSSNAAVGFELDVIAAVVLGGTSLMGGRGSVAGTVLGALTIAVIGNGLIDITEAEGADPARTVLCHMNPSGHDAAYQDALARRGAFLEYDMVGMDYWYADQGVQCPSDEENARAIVRLAEAGHLGRVLLSQDVFLKMMLTRHGGFGYAYVQRHFLPRLRRMGLSEADLDTLMVQNPRRVFDASAGRL